MTAGVYLIRAENGLTKVGHSSNVENRLRMLATGSPIILTLLHVIETDRRSEVERALHRRFAAQRRLGEWFELSEDDITAATASVLAEVVATPAPAQKTAPSTVPTAPPIAPIQHPGATPSWRRNTHEAGAAAQGILSEAMDHWVKAQHADDKEGASQWFEITQGILQAISQRSSTAPKANTP